MTAGTVTDTVSSARSRRRRGRELRVSHWLQAGALGVGIGAAVLGGSGVAHADGSDASDGAGPGTRGVHSKTADTASHATGRASGRSATRGFTGPQAQPPAAGDSEPAPVSDIDDQPAASTPEPAAAVSASEVVRRPAAATASTGSSARESASQPAASTPVITNPAAGPVPAPKAAATGSTTGWQPGTVISIFISDGTLTHPDAGLLIGNGFSFTAVTCATGNKCNGGQAGFLYGNGGNGWNGGNGGNSGLMGNGGNGGNADRYTPFINGGNGGRAGIFWGNGGNGGSASVGANGGDGGKGGLFGGTGGNGGIGGPGAVQCSAPRCQVTQLGGKGGEGARGGLIFGTNGRDGAAPLPLSSLLFVGYDPVYPVLTPDGKPEINSNGTGAIYPNENDPSKPYAVPGTVVASVQLPVGFVVGRWGYPTGGYLAPVPTYLAQASLPPVSQVAPYFNYVVKDPAALPPGYRLEQSQLAPWFGQPGGGVQYRIIFTDSTGKETTGSVQALLDSGYLGYQ